MRGARGHPLGTTRRESAPSNPGPKRPEPSHSRHRTQRRVPWRRDTRRYQHHDEGPEGPDDHALLIRRQPGGPDRSREGGEGDPGKDHDPKVASAEVRQRDAGGCGEQQTRDLPEPMMRGHSPLCPRRPGQIPLFSVSQTRPRRGGPLRGLISARSPQQPLATRTNKRKAPVSNCRRRS